MNKNLEAVAAFLVERIPGPRLTQAVRIGHSLEIDYSIMEMAQIARARTGNLPREDISDGIRNQILLEAYHRFKHLIPQT